MKHEVAAFFDREHFFEARRIKAETGTVPAEFYYGKPMRRFAFDTPEECDAFYKGYAFGVDPGELPEALRKRP